MSNDDTGITFKEGFLQTKVYGQTRWQRRYCIIDWDKAMLFIALKNDRKLGDYVALLPRVLIKDSEIATDLTIEIVADKQSHYLLPESKKEHDSWLIALKRTAYSRFGGGIFGQSLQDTFRYACGTKSPVPVIVQQCCEFLLEHGTTFVGLFRVPGKQSHVRELRDKYDRCQPIELDDSHSPATIASLLKIYLQALPEPIIPMKYFDDFLEIGTRFKYDPTKELDHLKHHVKASLPKINYALLAYLCLFLRKLTEYAQETKMDTENLAIAFGSNLIRASDDLDMNMIKGLSLNLIPLIKAFIDHSEYIFCGDENESSEKTDESIRKSSGFSSFSSLLSTNDRTNLARTRSSSLPTIPFAASPFVDSANFSFDGRSDNYSNQYRSQSPSVKSDDHTSNQSNSPQSSTTYIQGDTCIVEENDEHRWTNSVPVEDREAMHQEKRKSALSWQFGLKSTSPGKKKSFVDKVGKSITSFTTTMSKAFIPHTSILEATPHGHTIDVSSVRPDQRRSVDSNLTDGYLKILHDEICVLKGIIDKKEAIIIQLNKDSDEERLQHRQKNRELQRQIEQLKQENSQLKAFHQADN